jgi:hypothetical protein
MKVKVYPLSVNALKIRHPTDGPLKVTGSEWENDGFTARMLTDGEVTLEAPAPAPSAAPAAETEATTD